MKSYIGTKVINAKPMNRLDYSILRGWTLPANEDGRDEGYLVEYVDGGSPNMPQFEGYVSWSPEDVFKRSYIEHPTSGFSFGYAVTLMKAGRKVARAGWNGKGMFVYYVPPASYPVQTGAAKSHFGEGSLVPYNAYMAIKNVDDTVSTWVPSSNDCISIDWMLV